MKIQKVWRGYIGRKEAEKAKLILELGEQSKAFFKDGGKLDETLVKMKANKFSFTLEEINTINEHLSNAVKWYNANNNRDGELNETANISAFKTLKKFVEDVRDTYMTADIKAITSKTNHVIWEKQQLGILKPELMQALESESKGLDSEHPINQRIIQKPVKIQKVWRDYIGRKKAGEAKGLMAAEKSTQIQKVWRGYIGRKEAKELMAAEKATLILELGEQSEAFFQDGGKLDETLEKMKANKFSFTLEEINTINEHLSNAVKWYNANNNRDGELNETANISAFKTLKKFVEDVRDTYMTADIKAITSKTNHVIWEKQQLGILKPELMQALESESKGLDSEHPINQRIIQKPVKIQKVWRGYIGRKKAGEAKELMAAEKATQIQKVWRGYIGRKKAGEAKELMAAEKATQIQKGWRGYIGRKKAKELMAAEKANMLSTPIAVQLNVGFDECQNGEAIIERIGNEIALLCEMSQVNEYIKNCCDKLNGLNIDCNLWLRIRMKFEDAIFYILEKASTNHNEIDIDIFNVAFEAMDKMEGNFDEAEMEMVKLEVEIQENKTLVPAQNLILELPNKEFIDPNSLRAAFLEIDQCTAHKSPDLTVIRLKIAHEVFNKFIKAAAEGASQEIIESWKVGFIQSIQELFEKAPKDSREFVLLQLKKFSNQLMAPTINNGHKMLFFDELRKIIVKCLRSPQDCYNQVIKNIFWDVYSKSEFDFFNILLKAFSGKKIEKNHSDSILKEIKDNIMMLMFCKQVNSETKLSIVQILFEEDELINLNLLVQMENKSKGLFERSEMFIQIKEFLKYSISDLHITNIDDYKYKYLIYENEDQVNENQTQQIPLWFKVWVDLNDELKECFKVDPAHALKVLSIFSDKELKFLFNKDDLIAFVQCNVAQSLNKINEAIDKHKVALERRSLNLSDNSSINKLLGEMRIRHEYMNLLCELSLVAPIDIKKTSIPKFLDTLKNHIDNLDELKNPKKKQAIVRREPFR
ncbi:MAG: hypothetical protein VW397_05790 [Candidatus Margulisiibacteriota bacterium]